MSNDKHDQYIKDAVKAVDPTFEAIVKSRTGEFDDTSYAPFFALLGPSVIRFIEAYRGGNGFLNNVRAQHNRGKMLSAKQHRAVTNIIFRAIHDQDLSGVHGAPSGASFAPPSGPAQSGPKPPPAPLAEGTILDAAPTHVTHPGQKIEAHQCFVCQKWVVGDYNFVINVHKPACRQAHLPGSSTTWTPNGSKNTQNIERAKPKFNLDLRSILVPKGRYAIELPNGEHVFYLVETLKRKRKLTGRFNWSKYPSRSYQYMEVGSVVIRKQSGDTKEFVGMQLPTDDFYVGEHEDHIKLICDDPVKAMTLYGQIIGSCAYCGRSLTDEDSRRLGIGPDCLENKHIPFLQRKGTAALSQS